MDELAAQQSAGAIVVRPSSAFLTACQTLNWIAFQRAEDGDLTGRQSLWREFGYEPKAPPDFNPLDYAVAEAADQLNSDHRARLSDRMTQFGREWREMPAARDAVQCILADRGWQAIELDIYLQKRRGIWVERMERLWTAQQMLMQALVAKQLTAWASPAASSDTGSNYNRPRAAASASAIPWQFFLTRNALVHPAGEVTADADPGYLHATFRTAEVLALWPLTEVQVPTPDDRTSPNSPNELAAMWMASHVTERGKWKMESAIAQCRTDTGSTYREAKAAWQKLPEGLRGKRGAHK